MITPVEINSLYKQRQRNQSSIIAQMRAVRDQYNGDIVIPLPEIDRAERPMVANILQIGLDQTAKRIASTTPDVFYPPVRPGIQVSEERAKVRRRANLAWWDQNNQGLKLRRRARWLTGYSSSPVVLRPNMEMKIPEWSIRNPLTAYLAPSEDPDSLTPKDGIFVYRRSYQWLRACYPMAINGLYMAPQGSVPKQDDLFDLLEYHDANESVLCVVGKQRDQYDIDRGETWGSCVELERVANRIGLCPVVAPATISLDRQLGLYDGALGMYMAQAKLMATSVIGAYKEVIPETWVVARPNENAQIITQPDPIRGVVGEISGGEVHTVQTQVSQSTQQMIDRLDHNQRVESGFPAEYGGESASNIRTGRRGDAVMSATVDFTIQECQEILQRSLEEENRRAIAIDRAYFGTQRKTFWVNWDKVQGTVDYVPNEVFTESDRQIVRYSYAGADANNFVVSAGQRLGLGTMSRKTFMEIDPLVPDSEREHEYVIAESLEQAALASIQQQAQGGQIPIGDMARIATLALDGKHTLFQAIEMAQKEAQTRQASSGPPGTPEGPVQPGSPDAQPGLAQPGAGAEAATVGAPSPNIANLAGMLRGLHRSGEAAPPAQVPSGA